MLLVVSSEGEGASKNRNTATAPAIIRPGGHASHTCVWEQLAPARTRLLTWQCCMSDVNLRTKEGEGEECHPMAKTALDVNTTASMSPVDHVFNLSRPAVAAASHPPKQLLASLAS